MKEQERDFELLTYIAHKCKDLRAKKGVSQETAFEDTGVSISKIETARKNITVSTLSKLCRYFEITIPEFFREYYGKK